MIKIIIESNAASYLKSWRFIEWLYGNIPSKEIHVRENGEPQYGRGRVGNWLFDEIEIDLREAKPEKKEAWWNFWRLS